MKKFQFSFVGRAPPARSSSDDDDSDDDASEPPSLGDSSAFRNLLAEHYFAAQRRQHELLALQAGNYEFQLDPCMLRLCAMGTFRGVVVGTLMRDEFCFLSARHPMVRMKRIRRNSVHCNAIDRLRALCGADCVELQRDKVDLAPHGDNGAHALLSVACRLLGGLFYYKCQNAWFVALEELDEQAEWDQIDAGFRQLGPAVPTPLMTKLATAEANKKEFERAMELQKLAVGLCAANPPWKALLDTETALHAVARHMDWRVETVRELTDGDDARLKPCKFKSLERVVSAVVMRAPEGSECAVAVALDANGSVMTVQSHLVGEQGNGSQRDE